MEFRFGFYIKFLVQKQLLSAKSRNYDFQNFLLVFHLNTQIIPILLYGSEVWDPCVSHDYVTWNKSATERTRVQSFEKGIGMQLDYD